MSKTGRVGSDGVMGAKLRWTDAVLVCGKCLKRSGDGKALRRALTDALGERAGEGRRAKVVRTACLGPCPKRGVVLASGAGLVSGRAVVLREGGDVDAALARLERPEGR